MSDCGCKSLYYHKPACLNQTVTKGASWVFVWWIEVSQGMITEAFDLTDYVVECEIRTKQGDLVVTPTALVLVPATEGRIQISLTPSQTYAMNPGIYVYDVFINNGVDRRPMLYGTFTVKDSITELA
jgi:hypothetical protein